MHKSRVIGIVALVTLGLASIALCSYVAMFGTALSSDQQRWADFGSYLSGTVGVALSAATLIVAVYASVVFPRIFEEQRATAERRRQTIELSHRLFDREFYAYVTAPAWEIAVKWLYWKGDEGAEYRRQVCGGMFLYAYPEFSSAVEANAAPYQNLIRFKNHFQPYDVSAGGSTPPSEAFNQLSEHQVLAVWLQFWVHLHALLKAQLVDEALARELFRDWYGSWLKFMIQFRVVGQQLAGAQLDDGSLRSGAEPDRTKWRQLRELEQILFSDGANLADIERHETQRAMDITADVIRRHNEAGIKQRTES